MGMTDPLADMLTRIRNGCMVKKKTVDVPASKIKSDIAKVLKDEGYIKTFKTIKDDKQGVLRITLKYDDEKNSVVEGIKRVSKPGCRVYARGKDVPKVINGYGIAIVSTSKGLMVDREARKSNTGGEILCNVW